MDLNCAIFDLDGTLVDTVDAHVLSWTEACRRMGITDVSRNELISLFGRTSIDIAKEILRARSISLTKAEQLSSIKDKLFEECYVVKVRRLPGAKEVLSFLKSRGVKVVIVSSNPRSVITKMLVATDLKEYVDLIIGQDDVSKGKPSPEPILKALSYLKAKPEDAIMVGDSIYDVQASIKAGVLAIGIATGVSSPIDLLRAGARFVVMDLYELKRLLEYLL